MASVNSVHANKAAAKQVSSTAKTSEKKNNQKTLPKDKDDIKAAAKQVSSTAKTSEKKNNQKTLPKDKDDIKAAAKQVPSTTKTSEKKNNQKKLPKDKDDIKAAAKQVSSTAKTSEKKNNQKTLPKDKDDIKAAAKQVPSTTKTSEKKNNQKKLPKDKDDIKAAAKQVSSTAKTSEKKNNQKTLPKDKDDIKAAAKQVPSTTKTSEKKNNQKKLPKDKDDIKAAAKQVSSTAKTSENKNNQTNLPKDKDDIKDGYSWTIFAGFRIPYIIRLVNGKNVEFVSTWIAENRLLKKYLKNVHSDIYTSCTYVKGYGITDLEAKILNYINKKHYGIDSKFLPGKDYIVLLDDFIHFYIFLEVCYTKLLSNNTSIYKNICGFIYIDSASVVPYCAAEGKKYVPVFFFEDETDILLEHAVKLSDWHLAYLKFCCKVAGVKEKWLASEFWPVVSFDHVKNLLPPETDFKDFWPGMLSDLFLFTRKKFMHHNPPGSWFKVLPEVVTDENSLTASVVPQSTESMMNQMLQQEQQQQDIITTPPTQAHKNADNVEYKVRIVLLEGKIIYCINTIPGIYDTDLIVTLKEIVQMVLPLCNVAKCAHVLFKYLKIPILFGKSEQLAVLWENKLIWSMNPGDIPMAKLQDIEEVLPLLKRLVPLQDKAIEQYLSTVGLFK